MVKLLIHTPCDHTDRLLNLLVELGIGKAGPYDSWSLVTKLVERYRPLAGATPFQGEIGQLSQIEIERIEVQVPFERWQAIVDEVTKAHPYQMPAIEVIPLIYP